MKQCRQIILHPALAQKLCLCPLFLNITYAVKSVDIDLGDFIYAA